VIKKGTCFTRQQIRDIVGGGSVQNCMPNDNGRILCVCLSQPFGENDPKVILVGAGPAVQKEAEIFCDQGTSVPVFFKKMANQWEYAGDFKPVRWTDDPQELNEYSESSGRINLTKVIFLQENCI
jgi:hypothetical protein